MEAIRIANFECEIFNSSANLVNTTAKQAIAPMKTTKYRAIYAQILLRECTRLIELISHLDQNNFQAIYSEVNTATDHVGTWLNGSTSIQAIDVYATVRKLKKKVHHQIKLQHNELSEQKAVNVNLSVIKDNPKTISALNSFK